MTENFRIVIVKIEIFMKVVILPLSYRNFVAINCGVVRMGYVAKPQFFFDPLAGRKPRVLFRVAARLFLSLWRTEFMTQVICVRSSRQKVPVSHRYRYKLQLQIQSQNRTCVSNVLACV